MSSAEATLQPRTTVGNTSPTMLQTLLILANLYETDDTDPVKWRIAIESHPRIFVHFLRALTPVHIPANVNTQSGHREHLSLPTHHEAGF
ncbi:MAG: hypothetical protein HOC70_08480 [Gammaproteobacteria bacterium]|nr:hypothetical protein [Gammaproteobacteria bacterium]